MGSSNDLRLSNILTLSVTNNLKPLGFRKHGNVYIKPLEELSWIITVQKSQWNSQNNSEFTLNCGIYVPRVVSIYSPALINRPEPLIPKLTDCCVYCRVGMLTENRQDMWWQLNEDIGKEKQQRISEDVSKHVIQNLRPFLQRFTSTSSVIHFLEAPRREQEKQVWPMNRVVSMAYLSILYFLSDRRDDCCITIADAELKADQEVIRQNITRLRQYLCS